MGGRCLRATPFSLYTERWKRVRFPDPEIIAEFYDHAADPEERTNLIASTDPTVQAATRDLDARLCRAMASIDATVPAREDGGHRRASGRIDTRPWTTANPPTR